MSKRGGAVMSTVWNAATYDSERRRLVPCFDDFYGSAAELVTRCFPSCPRILDLGAGTGILSAAIVERVVAGRLTHLPICYTARRRGSLDFIQR
jgi:tRNA (cmo5U34)-methyltransferase